MPLVARIGDCLPTLVAPVSVGEIPDKSTGEKGQFDRRKTVGELHPQILKDKLKYRIS